MALPYQGHLVVTGAHGPSNAKALRVRSLTDAADGKLIARTGVTFGVVGSDTELGWPLEELWVAAEREGLEVGAVMPMMDVMAELSPGRRGTLWRTPSGWGHDRVRASYDTVAHEYAARFSNELAHKPLDRALLAALIEQTDRGAPIADLGCGPGHVAAQLAQQGIPAVGIDLAPEMIAIGRREHPQVEFREGDLLSLPAREGEFGSVVALYSIIHLQPFELHLAFDEIHRTLRPSGLLLVGFHVGSEVRHAADWWGNEVDVDFRFFEPAGVIEPLEDAGFVVEATVERTNYPEEVETRRAYILARRRMTSPPTAHAQTETEDRAVGSSRVT